MNYKLSYPAITGEVVTQGHIAFCEREGHAVCYVDGVRISLCPRCGTDVAIFYKDLESAVEATETPASVEDTGYPFYESHAHVAAHAEALELNTRECMRRPEFEI